MPQARNRAELQQLNVRVPREVYEALRTYAYATNSTINDAAVQAIVNFLSTNGREKQVDAFLKQAQRDWRTALDKLADL